MIQRMQVFSDKTRYAVMLNGEYRRHPAKPYRNKSERKKWKRQRQVAAGLR